MTKEQKNAKILNITLTRETGETGGTAGEEPEIEEKKREIEYREKVMETSGVSLIHYTSIIIRRDDNAIIKTSLRRDGLLNQNIHSF